MAALSGVQVNLVDGDRGRFCVEDLEHIVRPPNHHFAQTALISVENTTNNGGGTIFGVKEIARIREFATEHELRMHLDGARLLNACVETGVAPREYAQHFDTVSICLSKGLGAPVGSVLAGSAETMDKAHKFRKMFGGGMRQAGIIAAAGIYALDNNIERLKEDHRRARRLAEGISSVGSLRIKWPVDTNFVMIDVSGTGLSVPEIVERLGAEGVHILGAFQTLRAVTHLDVDDEGIEHAVEAFRRLFG
jgi:threonine aldolase